ncbi:MAG: phosphoribosylanthranilate isomerase [Kiritimatiellia bacterium]
MFVKICGIAREADARAIGELHPDAMGFVFWPGSKRCVKPEDVAAWTRRVPSGILKVGVFVDATVEEIDRIRSVAGLDVVQLHGKEGPTFCRKISGALWKAVNTETFDSEQVGQFLVDAFLVDSASAAAPGGTGVKADWNKARNFVERSGRLVLLAGGLTPANVRAAIDTVHPWGVDVSSGVESEPGAKDIDKVRAFIKESRGS